MSAKTTKKHAQKNPAADAIEGRNRPGPKLTDEIRARIFAEILSGKSDTEIAREHALHKATIGRLRAKLGPDILSQIAAEKKFEFEELLAESLAANLKAQANILQHVTNAKWLDRQDADALGVLFGIISDKSIRLFEACEKARGVESGAGPGPEL